MTRQHLGHKPQAVGATADWQFRRVGEMGDVLAGKALNVGGSGALRPYLRTKNVLDGRIALDDVLWMPMTDAEFARFRVVRGDVLLNEGQSLELVGRCSIYDDEFRAPCAMQNQLLRFRAYPGTSPEFAAHLFRYCQRNGTFSAIATQTTSVAHLGSSRFSNLRLLWPTQRKEQEAIAEALSNLDDQIFTLERLIAKKQAIKQGMMQQLLTSETRLPGFTKPWSEVHLGEHVTYVKTVALSRAQLDNSSPLRYLHYGDIHTRFGVTLDATIEDMPRASKNLARNAGRLQPGDLVFADASEDPTGVGKSVEVTSVPKEGVVPGLHTIAARFDKAVLADGFKAYLQFIPTFRNTLLRLAAGTKVLATTRSYISSVVLSLPQIDEQQAIAAALGDSDSEIAALSTRLAKAKAIKQGMVQEILTGRTRLPIEEATT